MYICVYVYTYMHMYTYICATRLTIQSDDRADFSEFLPAATRDATDIYSKKSAQYSIDCTKSL